MDLEEIEWSLVTMSNVVYVEHYNCSSVRISIAPKSMYKTDKGTLTAQPRNSCFYCDKPIPDRVINIYKISQMFLDHNQLYETQRGWEKEKDGRNGRLDSKRRRS